MLNGLRFGLTFDQFRTATYLQQWVELHQFRPSQSPLVAPKYWWHYAAKCVIGQRSGQAHRRAHRWDFTRLPGAAARRRRYVELYKRKLAVDAIAAGEDVGSAAGDKVLPAGIAREIDNLEVKLLTFEQALLYRYLAEVSAACVCANSVHASVSLWKPDVLNTGRLNDYGSVGSIVVTVIGDKGKGGLECVVYC